MRKQERELQEVIEKFRLSDEQIDKIFKTIIDKLSYGKKPSTNPIAVIVGGQSGAGKTSLMAYTGQELPNAVFIDNDDFRSYHPYSKEIKENYPEFYRQATDQLGMELTSKLVDYFMGKNKGKKQYDIIFHQTLKSNRIVDDAMTKFNNAGYIVAARVLAVSYYESKMSQIERCKAEYETMGYCRHVDPEAHWDAIKGIPYTVSYMEETGKYDVIQVYIRGKDISKPVNIYSKTNPANIHSIRRRLGKNPKLNIDDFALLGYTSAKEAVKKAREMDSFLCSSTLNERLYTARCQGGYEIPGMAVHIDELEREFAAFKKRNHLDFEFIPND